MKYIDEYREKKAVDILSDKLHNLNPDRMRIMEVCGSQTHTIMKYGLEELLPAAITLVHGPGCPVCVTPIEMIDYALDLSLMKDVVVATYGDMLRVPGTNGSMLSRKAEGADIRIIYSPLDAVRFAVNEPGKKVILFAIGFETTAPANAHTLIYAKKLGLINFFMLSTQVLIPPAVEYILSGDVILDGLLAPGHVCTVTGSGWCERITKEYSIPITITGFEPVDILEGILETAVNFNENKFVVSNQYKRIVKTEGNSEARKRIEEVFTVSSRNWRGLGNIDSSGYELREEFKEFNALQFISKKNIYNTENTECISGEILQGKKQPDECALFGSRCQPLNPVGAPMVSSEGACAAYYRYRRVTV
jgi:hydrogenase expression/formation protein HypD